MGSHISVETLVEYWPLVVFPIFILSLSFILAEIVVATFDQPAYVIPGIVFNNVTAMPLLLLQAISHSEVLIPLLHEGETIDQIVVRAKAYVLLHGIVHNISRFAFGPIMLKSTTKPEVVRRLSEAIDKALHHASHDHDEEERNTTSDPATADEGTSLFSSKYSGSEYGSTESHPSNAPVATPSASAVARTKSSPSNAKHSSSSGLTQRAKSSGTVNSEIDNGLQELEAQKKYFYQRARQLSRKSIDFDETRALLSSYFDKAVAEAATEQDILRKLRRDSRSGSRSIPSSQSGTESPPAFLGTHSQSAEQVVEDEDDPAYSSQSQPQTYVEESSGESSDESSLTKAEAQKSFYDILPTWLATFIKKNKPAPESQISKIYTHVSQFMNPAVVAGIAAVIVGVTPWLHWFFFSFSVMATSVTPSISNIGELYPALQLFALGSKLTKPPEMPPRKTTIFFISSARYFIVPIISISSIWTMINFAPKNIWPQDKLLNFILMIVPVGPPAITLAAVAEIAGIPEKEVSAISRMLVYLYAVAPLVAPTVAIALSIAYTIE